MDLWSRIIGGSRSLSTKSSRANSPTERLTAFKRTCNTLQQIWRSSNSPDSEQSATIRARHCVERLNVVLRDESRGPAPHPCLAYAASSQIFVTVTKLALSSYDEGMLRSATVFFNTLIDSEVDGVVDNSLFARALVDLVRRAEKKTDDIEGRLVELLFGVANNIRLQPVILSAWFAPRLDEEDDQQSGTNGVEFAGTMRKDDFPLFYLLVEYVHHAGRAGDFARTGLLYLIETASRSKDLERWLIESDLATLMATGLGALYSQLGSLTFSLDEELKIPHIIAHSDHAEQETALPPALGVSMDSFMAYLLFWQDTIDHCKSAEVVATLMDHFQVLFLEQLLYPSLLESSDVEGGSTSAVLTYLYRMLASIDQEDLVHRVLHFLLASASDSDAHITRSKEMSASRRKSFDVLAAFSEEAARPSPSLFNLRDLALLGLRSPNRQTVLATLRLLAVILQRHPSFSRFLIRTIQGHPARQRTVGALNAELEQLLTMATSIVDEPTLDESFGNYLKDASWILESQLCIPVSKNLMEAEPLQLRTDDPIIRELLGCLENFFSNTVIVNLALTEVLMSIASSHLVALDGWLLVDPSKYNYTKSGGPAAEHGVPDILEQVRSIYQEPTWSAADTPPLTKVLRRLVEQVEDWRKDVADFDILVAARRDLLHEEDEPAPGSRYPEPNLNPTVAASEWPLSTSLKPEQGTPRGRRNLQDLISPQRSLVGSPLRDAASLYSPPPSEPSESRSAAAENLRKRLATPFPLNHKPRSESDAPAENAAQETAGEVAIGGDSAGVNGEEKPEGHSASLGHVLTNVIILYEFLLEISAMVQARGTLFEEAGFQNASLLPQADSS
ncbi:Retinoic acid induced 16-like protein-domain-containing protein [Aspergillus egyptiacus]|nr:Retinoic acid induced 16-like protein-domain-containing protein [Aspergillus egyptiacus]